MMLEKLIEGRSFGFLVYKRKEFSISSSPPGKEESRETLARFYSYLETVVDPHLLRDLFNHLPPVRGRENLPSLIANDNFLAHYALGKSFTVTALQRLYELIAKKEPLHTSIPIRAHYNTCKSSFFEVVPTLPGIMPKLFLSCRMKAECKLLEKVREDLKLAAQIEDHNERRELLFSLLSFSAAYRNLDHQFLELPDLQKAHQLITYQCKQYLIGEGLKTITLSAGKGYPSFYLCQGTEIWPSQPYALGSILSNLATHGSATEAYAHSWRRIHKQLRDLTEESGTAPFVLGHSMGGALTIQIALYSHDLIASAHAFNPPVPNERDALFFKGLPETIKDKLKLYVNLDDPVFWRIGKHVIGRVTLLLGQKRWYFYPITLRDTLLFFPVIIKFLRNIRNLFPAHERILPLCKSYLSVLLSEEEIRLENEERKERFDALHFLPKLYDPLQNIISLFKKIFRIGIREEFLRNEIEIVILHERDLLDTQTDQNREEIEIKLQALAGQKALLQRQLFSLRK